MLTLENYLEEIRKDRAAGWSRVFSDLLGQPLYDKERFLKAVDIYGEVIVFEAIVVSASKKLRPDSSHLNYVLAVANQKWKQELEDQISSDEDSIAVTRAIEKTKEAGLTLAQKIEKAKRRGNATDNSL